jgi:hypothetical protein
MPLAAVAVGKGVIHGGIKTHPVDDGGRGDDLRHEARKLHHTYQLPAVVVPLVGEKEK